MSAVPQLLSDVLDATWPAASVQRVGPWRIRDGQGGGQRVSAATAAAPVTAGDIPAAEAAMAALGQKPVFMLRPGEEDLDRQLAARDYRIADPVNVYLTDSARLGEQDVPRITTFDLWEPLAIMEDIWAEGGIGPERLAVMHRAQGPRTAIFGRIKDQPGGVAFIAGHDGVAMLHALEIGPDRRRAGLGRFMMYHAGRWAQANGLDRLAVICTRDNAAANGLYRGLGMECVTRYHYRRRDG